MSKRLKGQEVTLSLVRDGRPKPIGKFQSVTLTIDMERLEEEYIGATSMEYDSIYNGTQIESDFHLPNDEYFKFAEALKLRAERRTGGAIRIDAAIVMSMPDGSVKTFVLIDLEFAELAVEVGSRKDFVSGSIDGKTSKIRFPK
jgi:hypothetical protein